MGIVEFEVMLTGILDYSYLIIIFLRVDNMRNMPIRFLICGFRILTLIRLWVGYGISRGELQCLNFRVN